MNKIYIIGLGPGNYKDLTLEAVERMKSTEYNYLRTEHHPTVDYFKRNKIAYKSFDYLYNRELSFEDVYTSIVDKLIKASKEHGIVNYFVPGHPLVAEKTVEILLKKTLEDIEVEVVSGLSFVEPILELVEKDPINGLQIVDAIGLKENKLDINLDTLITQVYNKFILSEIKLKLSNLYGDQHLVYFIQNAGNDSNEVRILLPIYKLDRDVEANLLTSIYVPGMKDFRNRERFSFGDLLEIMSILRSEEGCPWDREQDHKTLRGHVIEEAYELVEAINQDDLDNIIEELGDLLLQVLFHSQIGLENYEFDIYDVLSKLGEKLIYRHPHIFSEKDVANSKEIVYNWDVLKYEERQIRTYSDRLKDIKGLPSLLTSYKVQKEAGNAGFDWKTLDGPTSKVIEEFNELKEALEVGNRPQIENELGDLLFSVVNIARFLEINPEVALNKTITKFIKRFTYIEESVMRLGYQLDEMSLEELEKLWIEAKSFEE